jgi:hypothetical protein
VYFDDHGKPAPGRYYIKLYTLVSKSMIFFPFMELNYG